MMKILNPFAGLLGATFALAPALVQAQSPSEPLRFGYGPHMMDWGGGWFGMIFGLLSMIVMLAVVIGVVVLLVRWLGGTWHAGPPPHHHAPPPRTPLDIL